MGQEGSPGVTWKEAAAGEALGAGAANSFRRFVSPKEFWCQREDWESLSKEGFVCLRGSQGRLEVRGGNDPVQLSAGSLWKLSLLQLPWISLDKP